MYDDYRLFFRFGENVKENAKIMSYLKHCIILNSAIFENLEN